MRSPSRFVFIAVVAAVVPITSVATVPTLTSQSGPYPCDGSATVFKVGFKFIANTDLVVTRQSGPAPAATLVLGLDYSAQGAGSETGGAVTLTSRAKCGAGYTLTITRATSPLQTTAFTSQGGYNSTSHETALDRLAMAQQDALRAQAARDAAQDQALSQGVAGGSATMVTASGSSTTRTLADWAATGPMSVSSSTITARGTSLGRPAEDRAAEVANVLDFGCKGDGVTDDAACIQAAINAGASLVRFPLGKTWVVASGLSLAGKSYRTLDLEDGTIRYTGPGTLFDLTQSYMITIRNGAVTATNSAAIAFATLGSTAALATTYPAIPNQHQWSNHLRFERLAPIVGFSRVWQIGTFSREIWITDCVASENGTGVYVNGKVDNLYVRGSILFSSRANSQGVVVRGHAGDARWRFAEGLFFNDMIVDVMGVAVDIRDVALMRWTGGQVLSHATDGVQITKGITPLTRDIFFEGVRFEAPFNIGAGLASGQMFSTQVTNVNFNSVAGTPIVTGRHTKGFTVTGATFDQPSGTTTAVSVGADNVNIRLNALNIDGAYSTPVRIDPSSRSGVKGQFSGAWTPVVAFGGASTGVTYQIQTGRWWWNDGLVFGFFQIALTSKGSSKGAATITGLPFTALAPGTATAGRVSAFSAVSVPVFDIGANSSTINVKSFSASESAVSDSAFANNTVLNGTYMYPVAQ